MQSLTVPGTLDSLAQVRDFVDRMVSLAGLDSKAGYRLRLAVDEVATNIVDHGYREAGLTGEIRVEAVIDEGGLTVSLEDTGVPYDPTAAEMPDNLDDPLEARQIGGLGIYLTMAGVDDFRYERIGNRNVNLLTMRRSGDAAPRETS